MITPILLCGGSGTRLWPLSRKSYPKQFTQLIGDLSLFQASVQRMHGPQFSAPVVVTGGDFRFVVREQLAAAEVEPQAVLIEPEARNTAPAILASALWLEAQTPGALMLIAPSDHVIPDAAQFRSTVTAAADAAHAGQIVTFGIRPDRPETGYGWLELSTEPGSGFAPVPQPLKAFVEKPDAATAKQMFEAGSYLWNAGIFLFSTTTLIEAFEAHDPDMLAHVRAAVENAELDLSFTRLAAEPFAKAEDISIDYAVMEKADNMTVVPFSGAWSDLGDWEAVRRELDADETNNALVGPVTALDCAGSLIRSEEAGPQVVGLGLRDMLVVATGDAVLVADRARGQQVKEAVAALKAKNVPQAVQFPWDERPWGRFETLALGGRFQVKRIVVKPGGILSLQSHHHRSEHWIVVEGTARVTIDDEVKLVTENQSVYIPLGAVHRMENPGKVPMVLIEVQTGAYLGEDDIIRYEDLYDRGQGAKG